jgi:hypothetical protein
MSEHAQAERYEQAIRKLQEHIRRADDGTFQLDIEDGSSIGIEPVVFADLQRSLEETNKKIRNGELRRDEITTFPL